MTTPSGIAQGYDLRGVNFSFTGPEDHTILTLTRRNDLGGIDSLVVDPSQFNAQDQTAYIALCAQRCIQQSAENKKLLKKATDSLNECKRMIAGLSGRSTISSASPLIEEVNDDSIDGRNGNENHEGSSITRFFAKAASKIGGFFLESLNT